MIRGEVDVEQALRECGLAIARTDAGCNGRELRCACPFCPASADGRTPAPTFSANESGAWHCHRCGEKGNMYSLRVKLNIGQPRAAPIRRSVPAITPAKEPTEAPQTVPLESVEAQQKALRGPYGAAALEYLRTVRGLSDATIAAFRLGFAQRGPNGSVSIPYLTGGACRGVKYRALPPVDTKNRYDRKKGFIHPLFGTNSLDGEFRMVAVVEGEFDAMAWAQYDLGVPVVSIPDGATAAWKDEHAAAIEHFDEVLLVYDNDETGDAGAVKTAERLGSFRCRRVRLPKKDCNECLVAGVPADAIRAAIEAGASCWDSDSKHISNWRAALLEAPAARSRGATTGWTGVDNVIGGLRPGEVTLLTASTGAGKTTWCLDLARRQVNNGHAVMVAALESTSLIVARKMLSSVAQCRWDKIPEEHLGANVDALCRLPIILLDRYGELTTDRLRREIESNVRRYGVRLVIIDHLHFLLGVAKAGEDERLKIDSAAKLVQDTALKLGIHILLVMHPAKMRSPEDGKARQPDIGDLKGSSGPAQFADNVARIARDEKAPKSDLTFLKVRSELGRPGFVKFLFNPETLRFADVFSHANGGEDETKEEPRDGRMLAAGGQ